KHGSAAAFITSGLERKVSSGWRAGLRVGRLATGRAELLQKRLDVAPDRDELLAGLRRLDELFPLVFLARLRSGALQLLLGPRDGEPLAVEQLAHPQQVLDV